MYLEVMFLIQINIF